MFGSMQCLAKRPSAFATYGAVWMTFGGATEIPMVTLRRPPGQLCCACARDGVPPGPAIAAVRTKSKETIIADLLNISPPMNYSLLAAVHGTRRRSRNETKAVM